MRRGCTSCQNEEVHGVELAETKRVISIMANANEDTAAQQSALLRLCVLGPLLTVSPDRGQLQPPLVYHPFH